LAKFRMAFQSKDAAMPILFEERDEWFRPRFVCDSCEQPIGESRRGKAFYELLTEPGNRLTRVVFCHANPACERKARAMLNQPVDGPGFCLTLAESLILLAADVGWTPADFAFWYNYMAERGMVPPPPGK
jgi:hypothetical protein